MLFVDPFDKVCGWGGPQCINTEHGARYVLPIFFFFFLVHPSIIAYISIMFVVGARLSWIFMLLGLGWVVVGGFEELGHV